MPGEQRHPKRGDIWFVKLHVDPPEKGLRPVLIVSVDARNLHDRADTVLAISRTTSIHKNVPIHVLLPSSETRLPADSAVRAEDITVLRKQNLVEPRSRLRLIGNSRICEIARGVRIAMGCPI